MGFAGDYFRKQKNFKPFIQVSPEADLKFIVVIPATREKDLMNSVRSLYFTKPVNSSIEIIILINASADAPETTRQINCSTFEEVLEFSRLNYDPRKRIFPILMNDLPPRDAGVGLARKYGMDEALWRFDLINNPGFIICFDADANCDDNFFEAIEHHTNQFPLTRGASIYFEHDFGRQAYPENLKLRIISYEIHLRYYKLALAYVGFPYSFHTVGSSMMVNARTYAQQGGMNKYKAGEDFYFLQKIIPLGEYYELNDTRIILSPRESDRVPFGTGAAMGKMQSTGMSEFQTYNLQSILELKQLFPFAASFFRMESKDVMQIILRLPVNLRYFLFHSEFEKAVLELNQNTAGLPTFIKRFFQWWNAFRVLKFLNYAHNSAYEKVYAIKAAEELLLMMIPGYVLSNKPEFVLETLRELERKGIN